MKEERLVIIWITILCITFIESCQIKLKRVDPPCPVIDSLSPNGAPMGATVSIKGKNFLSDHLDIYKINIGDASISPSAIPDANTIQFVVPEGKDGPVSVSIDMEGSFTCVSNTKDFVYYYTPLRVEKLAGAYPNPATCTSAGNCFDSPTGIDLDNQGNIIVADKNNFVIRKINASAGSFDATYGIFKPSPLTCDGTTVLDPQSAIFNFPYDVEVDASGDIYVAEEFNKTIRVLNNAGLVSLIAGSCQSGSSPGVCGSTAVTAPYGLSKDGDKLYYIDNGNLKVIDLSASIGCNGVSTILSHGPTQYFRSLEVSHARPNQGPIFIADEAEHNIKSVNLDGIMTQVPCNSANLSQPVALAIDSKGNIFIADKGTNQIYVLYKNGNLALLAGTGIEGYVDNTDALNARFENPSGLAINESQGVLYIADTGNNLIRKLGFK